MMYFVFQGFVAGMKYLNHYLPHSTTEITVFRGESVVPAANGFGDVSALCDTIKAGFLAARTEGGINMGVVNCLQQDDGCIKVCVTLLVGDGGLDEAQIIEPFTGLAFNFNWSKLDNGNPVTMQAVANHFSQEAVIDLLPSILTDFLPPAAGKM